LIGAAIAIVGGLASWLLVRSRDFVSVPTSEAQSPGDAAAEAAPAA
jgi:hypothetical protein